MTAELGRDYGGAVHPDNAVITAVITAGCSQAFSRVGAVIGSPELNRELCKLMEAW